MIERLTDEQLRCVARSFTEASIEAAAVNEAVAMRARVAQLEQALIAIRYAALPPLDAGQIFEIIDAAVSEATS